MPLVRQCGFLLVAISLQVWLQCCWNRDKNGSIWGSRAKGSHTHSILLGRGMGSLESFSSSSWIRFSFHRSLWTCHDPSPNVKIGWRCPIGGGKSVQDRNKVQTASAAVDSAELCGPVQRRCQLAIKANTKVVPVTSYRAEPCPASATLLAYRRRCTLLTDGAR